MSGRTHPPPQLGDYRETRLRPSNQEEIYRLEGKWGWSISVIRYDGPVSESYTLAFPILSV